MKIVRPGRIELPAAAGDRSMRLTVRIKTTTNLDRTKKKMKKRRKERKRKREERMKNEGKKDIARKKITLWRIRFIQRRNEIFNDYIAPYGAYCSRVDCAPLPTNSIGGYIMRLMGFRFSYKSHPSLGVNINHFPRGNNAAGWEKKSTTCIFTVASSCLRRTFARFVLRCTKYLKCVNSVCAELRYSSEGV